MVEVGLSGAYGAGKQMILDAEDWDVASAKYGSAWSLVSNGTGRDYVRAGRAALRGAAQQPRSHGNATLGRLLLDADPGEVVVYRNGNALDLSRPNLLKLSRAEAATWRREHEEARVVN
ncbi:hypothetical protein JMJ55_30320 [Belnapia sp. T6]|uniref:HNH endonuclease n=1 Tax=Belnapia mucosa TaxID=2804532 RepID=A0ABS1VD35_9PROT|nr:hypothetical protein [Belnapia mucosa]MBL6459599.1 hypothetical protein [Belnapia mucosa]